MQFSKFSSKDGGGEVGMNYESPITIMMKQIQNQIINQAENGIFKAVQDVGIFVDKDELVRALKYDRHQYEKGYHDRDAEIVRCKDCEMNNQCSIQFKFADPDDPEEWYCANGKRHEGR